MSHDVCPLCAPVAEDVLWHDDRCRVVLVDDLDYPGFCRVIWQPHVAEMTDLAEADRLHVMRIVMRVERAVREVLRPHKVNLASLGNQVPHLHWHVIPRFVNDPHFPDAIWAPRRRDRRSSTLGKAAMREQLLNRICIEAAAAS